jgi:Zn-dependent metalloprotease
LKKLLLLVSILCLAALTAMGQNSNANPRAFQASMAHFNANAKAYGLTDASKELKARLTFADQLGQTHIRFDQYVNGVRVFEGEAISHIDGKDNVKVTNHLKANVQADTTPAISEATAVASAVNSIAPRGGASTSTELVILPAGARSNSNRLVYHVTVETDNEIDAYSKTEFFIDAKSGATVWSFDATETAKPGSGGGPGSGNLAGVSAIGNTMWCGVQTLAANNPASGTYSLQDTTRGIGMAAAGFGNYCLDLGGRQSGGTLVTSPTLTFGNGNRANTDPDTAAADAHYGLMKTWDYYKAIHNRNGIDGAGTQTYSRVHYGRNYENAFWSDSCFCMTYGDGASSFYSVTAIDVAGHEMSHGVTSRSANLTYAGESGGLNESFSDIGGTMVEFFANNAAALDSSVCTAGNQDCPEYWIGERIYRSNWTTGSYVQTKALRYMDDPHQDGTSPACWSSTLGSLNVHYSSGASNHAFYLASKGGASKCNGANVAGIGNTKAAKIWYRALTVYMTASTNYAGARAACLSAATDLYGAGSAEYNTVAAAFSGINVN